ncbi:hypothetical protein N44_01438 [Microcystis aeruginosa NIES-44]|uniref:Uncharacterized protein n=1 Tax=Microcystis aeruginosa NIES-44 TaxID=449439 RepID=A0A0A1VP25_MICAE|nr:hypothetical protein N44_01438 [Microcystis aeruginosa NIES-44]
MEIQLIFSDCRQFFEVVIIDNLPQLKSSFNRSKPDEQKFLRVNQVNFC